MCLIVVAWNIHPTYELIVAANRDEYHSREAAPMHWWHEQGELLAGKDLQAGGSWLGVDHKGRFAAVTNYSESKVPPPGRDSRGRIVMDFLAGTDDALEFCQSIPLHRYAGVNVLTRSAGKLCYVSNRGDKVEVLASGIYGLSNASLDTPWPKLLATRDQLTRLLRSPDIQISQLLQLMSDRTQAPSHSQRSDSLPYELAKAVSAAFIVTPDYGTRCTTVLLQDYAGHTRITEQCFDARGNAIGLANYRFDAGVML